MEFNLTESIKILARTPMVLSHLLEGLPETWVKTNEGENTWSPYDVVGHLIHGEKTDWIPRVMIILGKNEDKTFVPFDRFAQFQESKGKSIEQLLEEFGQLRPDNIQRLQSMDINKEMLSKEGVHPEFGSVTLKQLLGTWVVHDLSHLHQITRVMAKNYKTEIGPWAQYLSVLRHEK